MDTIKLNIVREKNAWAAAVPYIVCFNDMEIAKLPNGRSLSLDVPADERFVLKFITSGRDGSVMKKITPHSRLTEHTVMIHPEYCKNGSVSCVIKTRSNLIGMVSMGWLRPLVELEISVDYK